MARRHGVSDENIAHALRNPVAVEDIGEDLDRWLLLGPDAAGNLLEVFVIVTAERTQIAIHAMPIRPKFSRLIET